MLFRRILYSLVVVSAGLLPSIAYTYIGPGIAGGALMISLGIVFFLVFLVVGALIYPIMIAFRKIRFLARRNQRKNLPSDDANR